MEETFSLENPYNSPGYGKGLARITRQALHILSSDQAASAVASGTVPAVVSGTAYFSGL